MAITDAKKRALWFDAGVRDFRASFQHAADGWASMPPAYACPLCAATEADGRARMKMYQKEHLGSLLTLEHVPPKHASGRPLVLTCRRCNNRAGDTIDARAHEVERTVRVLTGRDAVRGFLTIRLARLLHG